MKNANLAFKLDGETTDRELINRYQLDPALAGRPQINDAIRDAVYKQNIQEASMVGIDPAMAKDTANRLRMESVNLQKQFK